LDVKIRIENKTAILRMTFGIFINLIPSFISRKKKLIIEVEVNITSSNERNDE
jgi:hypothetical protein